MTRLREITDPFVVALPNGVRIRTRLRLDRPDEMVVRQVGEHLGSLAGRDLAERCSMSGTVSKHQGRTARKRALTVEASSRWAGAITRTTGDQWERAIANLFDEVRGLRSAIHTIETRLAVPVGERSGKVRGYRDQGERWQKQRRLQHLQTRLADSERRIETRQPSIVRGGSRLLRARHNLEQAGLDEKEWVARWSSARLFLTADGDAGQSLGNGCIKVHPTQGWCEVTLPKPLGDLSNTPGRANTYRLTCPVDFSYRAEEWAAQVESGGAVRYDITHDPDKDRWYLDASWTFPRTGDDVTLDRLRRYNTLAVDLNNGHLAAWIVAPDGNPIGTPITIPVNMTGTASTRDGHLRTAITQLLAISKANDCASVTIENLNFTDARHTGRETMGRGRRGKRFRRTVAGLPTARFRDRLACMAPNAGLRVIAVDPAYTSRWGGQHWLTPLQQSDPTVTRHHAAAVVIGRRSHGHKARRRTGDPASDQRIGTRKVPSRPNPNSRTATTDISGQGASQCHPAQKTNPPDPHPPSVQGHQHRSDGPTKQDSLLHGV